MTDKTIGLLDNKASPIGTDEIEIQETNNGDSKKVTLDAVSDYVLSNLDLSGAIALGGDQTDNVSIDAHGNVVLNGAATSWDDLMIPGHSVRTTGNSPPDFGGGFAGDSDLYYFAFDGTNTLEQVYFTIQMPHNWKQGSTIYPHVHFAPTSTNTGDTEQRVVRFILDYTWINIGSSFGAKSSINLDSDAFVPNTNQWKHLLAKNNSRNQWNRKNSFVDDGLPFV